MRKIIFIFISSLLIYCCNNDDSSPATNDIKKRVITLESYNSNLSNSFISDSIIEYYDSKKIIRKDVYYKSSNNNPYISVFNIYEHNGDNLLTRIKSHTDINLTNHYRTIDYNDNYDIQNVVSNKFSTSNLSSTLFNKTIHYEYILDTIKNYSIDHLNNDFREDLKTYITYGNLDSINSNNDWMYIYDNQNDITAINCLGNNYNCNETYEILNEYGNNREPLIDNTYGNKLNLFLLGSQATYGTIENTKRYLNKVHSIFPTPERNNNVRIYNYIFDEDNRLIEVYTTGTYLSIDRIKYYYQ